MINLLLIVIFLGGIASAVQSRKEGFPEISLNKLTVTTLYPGASPLDVETNVTEKLEEAVSEVEGIKEILSYSDDGISVLEVFGKEDLTPEQFRRMYSDTEAAVAAAEDLPSEIRGRPVLHEVTTSDSPVLEIAYQGDYQTLKPWLENLKDKVLRIPGVKNADLIGLPDQEIQILVDPVKASEYSLDLRKTAEAIRQRNTDGSGGTVTTGDGEKKVRISGKFQKPEDILETDIVTNAEGFGVRLKDVADLRIVPEDLKLTVRNNGEPGAVLVIRKTGSADLLDTVAGIHSLLRNTEVPDGIEWQVLFDQSVLTRDRLNLLIGNAAMGFFLVFAILLFFLNRSAAVWTAFGIPVSLLGMLIFLKYMDISLNLISLAGFIIIIGMLVDDAVVISEEYNSNREKGMTGKEAALSAVQRMWAPVLASMATTVIAFAPLFFVGGFPGAFIWTIPLMVIVGLAFSLAESFFMLPVHLSESGGSSAQKKQWIVLLENLYEKTLRLLMRYRYGVLLAGFLTVAVSGYLMGFHVRKDPFPQDGAESFRVSLTLPEGSAPEQSAHYIKYAESVLKELPDTELLGFSARIGTHSPSVYTERGYQSNLAVIFVYLTPYNSRDRNALEIIAGLREKFRSLKTEHNIDYSINLNRLGPPMGRDIEIRVISDNDEIRNRNAAEILEFISGIGGVSEAETDLTKGLNEIIIKPDYRLLSSAGISSEDLTRTIMLGIEGLPVTDMTLGGKRADVRLKLKDRSVDDPLRKKRNMNQSLLPIQNRTGYKVNISEMIKLTEKPAAVSTIRRIDGERSVTVYANTDSMVVSPLDVMARVKERFPSDQQVQIRFSGQPVETEKIFSGLMTAALGAVVGIYLIIALIFNSWSRPAVIMLSLPFMIPGAVFVMLTHSIPGSMMTGVALVGLMGVIVNASIVLVDTVTGLRQSAGDTGLSQDDLIIQGSVSRLRPVFLTTVTTVLGVLPTGYGIGGSDPFLSQMSLVLAYGLLFGTAVILVIVPVMLRTGLDLAGLRISGRR